MVRTIWVSSTQHTRTMEQYNSVSWFKLCIIRQSAFTGISGNMKVKNQTWLLVLEQVGIAVNAAFTQNYFTPSELLLEDLKFDIVYDNKMSLQSSSIVVSMAFLKYVPVVGVNESFYPKFTSAAASQACIFYRILHEFLIIISRQMKCEIYGASFLNLRVPMTICLLLLPRVHILFVYIIWL